MNRSNPFLLQKGQLLNGGRYRIEREINRGGTAVVYEAEDAKTNMKVALKVMNGPDQVPLKVVKREIDFSSSVYHDNIVRLLDVFAERHNLVIVWELISGPDLLDLLNEYNGRMPEPVAAFYFAQLVRAVQFMHDHGFCHRDIKPENCMVERHSNRLKLIDFGLSKHLESAKTLGVGTPDYMSPELLENSSRPKGSKAAVPYDARAVDTWAMGVMLYLLVSGKYPFEDPAHPNSLLHTINNVRRGHMQPLPPDITPECSTLISGLLQTNPSQRTKLHDIYNSSEWLQKMAQKHAAKIGKMDYITGTCVTSCTKRESTTSTSSTSEGMDVDGEGDQGTPRAAGDASVSKKRKSNKLIRGFKSLFKRKET